MHEPEGARPRARSPFAAAFLSLIFPGLGQLYAGAPLRALAFAAAPILALALGAGMVLRLDKIALLGFLIDPTVLDAVFVINLGVLLYRLVAIVDAYRVADYLNAASASGDGRAGRARSRTQRPVARRSPGDRPGHGRQPRGGRALRRPGPGLPRQRLHLPERPDQGMRSRHGDGDGQPRRRPRPRPARPSRPRRPNRPARPSGSALPEVSIPPWDGKERLNILLIGADQRPGEGTFNTDTLIVVSIDPVTKQVAMFSLPRDTVDVPVPPGPARQVFGSAYRNKINAWWTNVHLRSDLFSGHQEDPRLQRPQGDHGQPLRPRHQVLRRGQLRRLQADRRRDGRGDDQRPGAGLRRPLPVRPTTGCGGSTSRAASST